MVTEAAQESTTFTATFEIIVTGIRTTTVGNLTDVVKQVEWTMKGTKDGQTFELPQKTELGDPDPNSFVPLSSITDPQTMVGWVEQNETRLNAIKAHIQLVLDKMVAEASLAQTPLPWAPPAPPEPEPAPTSPPTEPSTPPAP